MVPATIPSVETVTTSPFAPQSKKVLLAKEGEHGNVLYMVPPLCITEEDVMEVVRSLDACLGEAEDVGLDHLPDSGGEERRGRWEGGGRYGDMD